MHIEIVVEDGSGKLFLDTLLPKILGANGERLSWRLHGYRGIGRIPKGLAGKADPKKRILLDQLPRLLRGYAKTPGIDAVLVVLDSDDRNTRTFMRELNSLAENCEADGLTQFCLAVEELEAWYMGDRAAIVGAYGGAKRDVLLAYKQDAVCGTWEILADAVYPGGSAAIKKSGWPLPGQIKAEWATKISPLMVPERNKSPSFVKLRNALVALLAADAQRAG